MSPKRMRPIYVVAGLLLLQAALTYGLKRGEVLPGVPDLERIPVELGQWRANGPEEIETPVMDVLQPDAYISRRYEGPAPVSLFAAYFRSSDKSGPHSPKICLPGAGWLGQSERVIQVKLAGNQEIPVNEYIVEKGRERVLVLYWYQNPRHVWAEEVMAKLYVLPDLIRYRRSDVTLVRVMVPIGPADSEPAAVRAEEFIRTAFPAIAGTLAAS